MRFAVPLFLLSLTACSGPAPSGPAAGTFAGAGKDRLCIAGEGEALRAGLIVYAADGAANCSLSGKLEKRAEVWTLTPKGESDCQIDLTIAGDRLSIATVPASCSYYCGPGASLVAKSFTRDAKATPAVDLGGDPLC